MPLEIKHHSSIIMKAFSTSPMSMFEWKITLDQNKIEHSDNIIINPSCPEDLIFKVNREININNVLLSISDLAKTKSFFSLKFDYQWGGCGAGGISLTIQSKTVTIFGPQHWLSRDMSQEILTIYQDEVMRFFSIWNYLIDTLKPALITKGGFSHLGKFVENSGK